MTNLFRRSTAFIAMLALLLSLFGVAAFAATTPTIVIDQLDNESVDVTEGDAELVLAVSVENNTGFAGLDLYVNVPDGWTIESFATRYSLDGTTLRSIISAGTTSTTTGHFAYAQDTNVTDDGYLFFVTVTVPAGTAASDDYNISLTLNEVSYSNEDSTSATSATTVVTSSFTTVGRDVTVVNTGSSGSGDSESSGGDTSGDDTSGGGSTVTAGGTIVVGDASIDVSETSTVVVPVSITDNSGFAGLTLTVSVPDGFEATSTAYYSGNDDAVTYDMTKTENLEGDNGVVLVFANNTNITDDGYIVWLTYTATSSAANGEFEISVTVDEAVDADDLKTNLAGYYTTESGTLTVSGVSEAEPEPDPDPASGTVSVGSVNANTATGTALVPVSIADNTGFAGMTLTVSVPEGWTTTNVYFTNGEDYAVTADMTSSFKVNAKTNDDVTVTFASAENMTDNGELCWIEYVIPSTAANGDTAEVTATVTEAYTAEALTSNWAENFTTVGGTITVVAPTITVAASEINVVDDSTALVPLVIENNAGFAGLTLTLTIPSGWSIKDIVLANGDDGAITASMTFTWTVNNTAVVNYAYTAAGDTGSGTSGDDGTTVTITFTSDADVTDDGTLCWIEYDIPAGTAAGDYTADLSVDTMYTASATTTNLASSAETVAGTVSVVQPVVTVGSAVADTNVGSTVLVPVSIENNTGFAGMTLNVSVPDGWTTTNVYFADGDDYAITADMTSSFKVNAKTNSDVTVTFASAENVSGDGVLCWIEYAIPSGASAGDVNDVSVTVAEACTASDVNTDVAAAYSTVDGTITVGTLDIALAYSGEETISIGDTAVLTADVAGDYGVYSSAVFSLTYDSSLFTFVSAEGAESVDAETAGEVTYTLSAAGDVAFSFTANSVVGIKTGTFGLSYSYTNSSAASPSVSADVTVAIAPVVTAESVAADNNVGTCVLVPISVEGNTGFAGMTLTVSVPADWTTTNVYFVNGDDYAITADMTSSFKIDAKSNGNVTVTVASAENVVGDGVLCWVEYTWTGSVDEGEYDVSVTVDEAYVADDLATNLASYYTAEDGIITVSNYGYSISADADSVTAGDTVTVTLTVTGDNTEDAVFYVTYSSDLFTFESADGAAAADNDGAVALTLTEAGDVTLKFTVNDCEESATGTFSTYYVYSGATESSTALNVSVSYVKYYTVTLQTSGGSEIASYSVSAGSTVSSVLTADDLSAGDSAGWIIYGGDGTKYTSEEVLAMTVTDDIIYRVYKSSSSGGSSGGHSSSSSSTSSSTTNTDDSDNTMNTTPIEIAATEIMTADEATAAVAAMTDVDSTAYYYDATLWAVQNGIINGTSDVTFDPEIGCTRAMIVTLLYRLAGSPEIEISDTGFSDVSESEYYHDAVLWAVANGITNGVGDDMFAPDEVCTREQIVTLLHRFDGQPETDTEHDFTDVDADYYSADAIAWAYANGITTGTSETTFEPTLGCTRAQVVTFLYRFAQG